MDLLVTIINSTISVLIFTIFVYVLLGYFLPPTHAVRRILGRVLEPLLHPIRKIVPSIGGFDLSPLILMIALQILGTIVVSILRRIN